MALSKIAVSLLEFEDQFLSCPVCFEVYSDNLGRTPLVLPCNGLHTYCKGCLVDLAKGTPFNVICPTCRETVMIPKGGVTTFKVDYTRRNLQDYFAVQKDDVSIQCRGCSGNDKATHLCFDCYEFLCHRCTDAHKVVRATKQHHLVAVSNLKGEDPNVFHKKITCHFHEDQPLVFFCDKEECKAPICGLCTVVNHKEKDGHKVLEVREASELYKRELGILYNEVELINGNLRDASSDIDETVCNLEKTTKEKRNEIMNYYASIRKLLDAHEKENLQELERINQTKLATLKSQKTDIEFAQASISSACSFTSRVLSHGNPVEILHVAKEMTDRLNKLKSNKIDLDIKENSFVAFNSSDMSDVSHYIGGIGSIVTSTTQPSENKIAVPKILTTGEKLKMVLTTYDFNDRPRITGGVTLCVKIVDTNNQEIPYELSDVNDGTYEVMLIPQVSGSSTLTVHLLGMAVGRVALNIKQTRQNDQTAKSTKSAAALDFNEYHLEQKASEGVSVAFKTSSTSESLDFGIDGRSTQHGGRHFTLTNQPCDLNTKSCISYDDDVPTTCPDSTKFCFKNPKEVTSATALFSKQDPEQEACPICSDEKVSKKLDKCGHEFCNDCIDRWFKHKPVCPICGEIYGVETVTGTQPGDGTMRITRDSRRSLPGYERYGAIIITYEFRGGVQGSEHPKPGKRYCGTRRVAYLPDNTEGREVLRLLQEAFDNRLVFTIGRSKTTGLDGSITWNGIHHKTNTRGGPEQFGYPDPEYLTKVKDELSAKGIK